MRLAFNSTSVKARSMKKVGLGVGKDLSRVGEVLLPAGEEAISEPPVSLVSKGKTADKAVVPEVVVDDKKRGRVEPLKRAMLKRTKLSLGDRRGKDTSSKMPIPTIEEQVESAVHLAASIEVPDLPVPGTQADDAVLVRTGAEALGGMVDLGEGSGEVVLSEDEDRDDEDHGHIFTQHLLRKYPDSCAVMLPHSSEVVGAREKPAALGDFARENFRACRLPYIRKQARDDPLGALNEAMGKLHEVGYMMVYSHDYMAAQKGRLVLPDVTVPDSQRLLREKDRLEEKVYKLQGTLRSVRSDLAGCGVELRGCARKLEKVTEELAVRTRELGDSQREVEEYSELAASVKDSLTQSEEANKSLVAEMERLREDNKKLSLEKEKLSTDLREASSSGVRRFLGSVAFKIAAGTSLLDLLRGVVYKELKVLSRFFPFLPEYLGYLPVPEEKGSQPLSLEGYSWDEENDRLIGLTGEEVVGEFDLQPGVVTDLPHVWSRDNWPGDIPVPDSPSDDDGTPHNGAAA